MLHHLTTLLDIKLLILKTLSCSGVFHVCEGICLPFLHPHFPKILKRNVPLNRPVLLFQSNQVVCLWRLLVIKMAPTRNPIGVLLVTYAISLFWTAFVIVQLLWKIITKGPTKLFYHKKRDTRPALLDDPAFGAHQFARLKVSSRPVVLNLSVNVTSFHNYV